MTRPIECCEVINEYQTLSLTAVHLFTLHICYQSIHSQHFLSVYACIYNEMRYDGQQEISTYSKQLKSLKNLLNILFIITCFTILKSKIKCVSWLLVLLNLNK